MLTGSGLAPAGEAQRVMDIIPLKGEQSSITSRRTMAASLSQGDAANSYTRCGLKGTGPWSLSD
jgi:hypothetical protein